MSKHIGMYRYAGASAAVLAFSLLGGCDKFKSPADFIQSAQTHRAHGEILSAVIDLKNALQKDPKNQKARLLLARYYLDFPDASSAQGVILRAREDAAPAKETASLMAEADLKLEKPEDALKETLVADDQAAGLSDPEKATLMGWRAQALLAQGHNEAALAAMQAGRREDPHSIVVMISMISYALKQHDLAQAKTYIAEAKKLDPTNVTVLSQEGLLAYTSGNFAGAETAYKQVRQLAHWNTSVALELARTLLAQNKLKEADAQLNFVLKAAPDDPGANYLQAVSAYRQHDLKTAQQRVERVLAKSHEFPPALMLAGATAYGLHQLEQASAYLTQYVFLKPDDLRARELLGAVEVALGRPAEAITALSPAAESSTDAGVLSTIAAASARTGDFSAANRYLIRAVEQDPKNAALRTQLGATQISLGNTQAGIEELERASRDDPSSTRPDVALILTYLQAKQFDKALELAFKLQKNHPDQAMGFDLAGSAQMAKGDEKAGEESFQKARSIQPGDAIALRSLGALAIKKNDLDLASKYYQELLKANPKDTQTSIVLSELEARKGHPDQMRAILQNAIDQNPDDDATPRLIIARYMLLNRQFQQASDMIEPALTKQPRNPALLEVYGSSQLALGNNDIGVRTFKTLTEVSPQASASHRYLAQAYAGVRDADSALSEAKRAVELDPKDIQSGIVLAQLYIATRNFDGARQVGDSLGAEAPKDVNVAELQAIIATAQNRREDSVVDYRRVVALRDSGAARADLARALFLAGHQDEARKTLESWLNTHPDDSTTHMGLGDMDLALNDFGGAAGEYTASLKQNPDNAAVENNLAWALHQKGDAISALDHARHAAQLSASSPDILDTLGVILLQNKKPAESIETLGKALALAPERPVIKFHLAQALVDTGDKDKARGLLREAVGSNLAFEERSKAQDLLKQLGG